MHHLVILLILIGLQACDCHIVVNGRVISSSTGKPIQDAKINMLGRQVSSTSDETGYFVLEEVTGFCYDPKIEISSPGYKSFRMDIASGSETLSYEVNTETQAVDFEEPVLLDSTNDKTYVSFTWIDIYSQDFRVNGDTIIFYLEEDNFEKEIEKIKNKIKARAGSDSD